MKAVKVKNTKVKCFLCKKGFKTGDYRYTSSIIMLSGKFFHASFHESCYVDYVTNELRTAMRGSFLGAVNDKKIIKQVKERLHTELDHLFK
jgi:hypothetical protein